MKTYKVDVLEFAYDDMRIGKSFYERQSSNLGKYFINSILTDIESLSFYGGIHMKFYGLYRLLSKRFPYGIYYDLVNDVVIVYAILDLRKNPQTNAEKLLKRSKA